MTGAISVPVSAFLWKHILCNELLGRIKMTSNLKELSDSETIGKSLPQFSFEVEWNALSRGEDKIDVLGILPLSRLARAIVWSMQLTMTFKSRAQPHLNFSLLHLSLDCNFLSLVQSSHDPNLERKSFSQRLYRECSAHTRQHGHLNPLPQTRPRLPHLLLHRSAHGLLCVSAPLSLPICIVFSALVALTPIHECKLTEVTWSRRHATPLPTFHDPRLDALHHRVLHKQVQWSILHRYTTAILWVLHVYGDVCAGAGYDMGNPCSPAWWAIHRTLFWSTRNSCVDEMQIPRWSHWFCCRSLVWFSSRRRRACMICYIGMCRWSRGWIWWCCTGLILLYVSIWPLLLGSRQVKWIWKCETLTNVLKRLVLERICSSASRRWLIVLQHLHWRLAGRRIGEFSSWSSHLSNRRHWVREIHDKLVTEGRVVSLSL